MVFQTKPGHYFTGQGQYSQVKGQFKATPWRYIPTPPKPMSLPSINFLYLMACEILPRQDFKGQGHTQLCQKSNQSHTMTLHTFNTLPKFLQSINFLRLMLSKTQSTKFKGSRSLRQGQKLNQCHTMTLHTHTTQPISLQHINFIHHAAFSDTPQTRFERSRSLKQGQRSGSQHTLSFVIYSQDNILNDKATKTRSNHGHAMIFKVTTVRSKVK